MIEMREDPYEFIRRRNELREQRKNAEKEKPKREPESGEKVDGSSKKGPDHYSDEQYDPWCC